MEICTQYAQKGMLNIFLTVFFSTLAFAFFEPFFFIGYLISIALFGLFQAIFMANAGGAWDNAKKIVEVELKMKGTPLHAATVVGRYGRRSVQGHLVRGAEPGHQVHDAVRTAGGSAGGQSGCGCRGPWLTHGLAAVFFVISMVFVYRSFYGMRIGSGKALSGARLPRIRCLRVRQHSLVDCPFLDWL